MKWKLKIAQNSKKLVWESSILKLTVPQEEDSVLGFVEIRLNIQGSVKSLLPFVVPIAGMKLFLYKQEQNTLYCHYTAVQQNNLNTNEYEQHSIKKKDIWLCYLQP